MCGFVPCWTGGTHGLRATGSGCRASDSISWSGWSWALLFGALQDPLRVLHDLERVAVPQDRRVEERLELRQRQRPPLLGVQLVRLAGEAEVADDHERGARYRLARGLIPLHRLHLADAVRLLAGIDVVDRLRAVGGAQSANEPVSPCGHSR